jgi:predicted transcriptional regulator YheO
MPGFVSMLGPSWELVLHNFSDLGHSLVAIEGHVTERKIGSPLTDLILEIVRKDEPLRDLVNYQGYTFDGMSLRSSTIFIRDECGKVIGCLCCNCELSNWYIARDLLNNYCQTNPIGFDPQVNGRETFVHDVEELLMGSINEVIDLENKPRYFMDKEDKIRVIKALDERGIFLIRKSVETVAKVLNVSRYTIYNYLDKARRSGSGFNVPSVEAAKVAKGGAMT